VHWANALAASSGVVYRPDPRPARADSTEGMKMKRLGSVLVAAVAVLVLAPAAFASHSWGGYHWARTANPFRLTFEDHVAAVWKPYLNGAAADWGATGTRTDFFGTYNVGTSPVTPVVAANLAADRKCRPVSGKVKVCDAAYGNNGWLGVAQIWASGKHITQATVKLNDTYYATGSFYDNAVWRAAVTCQESGHTFGLDHQDTSGANFHTCMDYANAPNGFNQHPNRDDYDELGSGAPSSGFHTDAFNGVVGAAIYSSHLDSTTTVAATPATAGSVKRVHDDLWVQDLGDGQKRFIFVYWTTHGGHGLPPGDA
jgi:hypothetical protein